MLLNVENISKSFSGIRALDNVTLEVKERELSSVIGPNGAGKSTLFNVITGHIKQDEGKITFCNEVISNMAPYDICLRKLGRSFQKVNIFPGCTTFQNVQISNICSKGKGLRFLTPYSKIGRDETLRLLEEVGLQDKRDVLAEELPYGDQKRLEMALALSNNPKLLLLDEPTAGVSLEETKKITKLIERLAYEKAISVMIVEHDMEVVFAISQKIRVMHQGRIIFEGAPDDVKRDDEVKRIYLGEE